MKFLSHVSDERLIDGLKDLVAKERKCTHEIVLHLVEFSRRRLFADLGYTSMFDYLTRGLGYSNASAQRRICAARAVAAVPQVYDCLEKGKLSLGVLEVAADAIAKPGGKELLNEICGRGKEEALRIVAQHFPIDRKWLLDRVEPIAVKKPETDLPLFKGDKNSNYFRAEVEDSESERSYRINLTVTEEFVGKLERVKDLMILSFGETTAETLEACLDEYIKRHDPEQKLSRRQAREKKRVAAVSEKSAAVVEPLIAAAEVIVPELPAEDSDPALRRYPSSILRDEVLARDGFECSFVSDDGVRCRCRSGLQIDHILPWAYGGRTEASNLRTVCQTHNLMHARRIFGDAKIEEAIAARRPDRFGIPVPNDRRERMDDSIDWMLFES